MLMHPASLWVRAHGAGRYLSALLLLALMTPLTRLLNGGSELPRFFEPMLVPLYLAIAASISWEGQSPHLEQRNPNLVKARIIMILVHTGIGEAMILLLSDAPGTQAASEGARSYLLAVGILSGVMSILPAGTARVILLARTLPATVLLPEPSSPLAMIWWEFQEPTTSSFIGCVAIWAIGSGAFAWRGLTTR
jgi:hypothetical protein